MLTTAIPITAATVIRTWNNFSGVPDNLWSTAANWAENLAPRSSDDPLELTFGAQAGAGSFDSLVDLQNLQLTQLFLNLQGGAAANFTGAPLVFKDSIVQTGAGTANIENDFIAAPRTTQPAQTQIFLTGTGSTGTVILSGVISGTGGLRFEGGTWRLTNVANSFSGGITVRDGAVVELCPGSLPGGAQGVDLSAGTASIVGSNIAGVNGGTLKLTTSGGGGITLDANKVIRFQPFGGVLDLTNANTINPTERGGYIENGDLWINLNNASTATAVIRFNGGQLGLPSNNLSNGSWDEKGNTLRISTISASAAGGPLRVELDNGAYYSATTAPTRSVTIRGKQGGDPTSGPTGEVNTGVGRDFGRYSPNEDVLSYTAGLRFEDAIEVSITGASRQITGNITIAGTASEHPGYVAFNGRATDRSSQLNSQLTSPGGGGLGQNVLHLGGVPANSDALTIETGGIAVLDARLRIEQEVNHGVALNSQTVIAPGGVLRFAQSISNFNFDPTGLTKAKTNANVGDMLVRGRIVGQGTTSSESLVDIQLPEPVPADLPDVPEGLPRALTEVLVTLGDRPFGGLRFIDSTHPNALNGVNQDLVINGTGFGGLRVAANARPNLLFRDNLADPVANDVKLASVLAPARLSRVSGTGGYLTPAPTGTAFKFPSGGMWSDPDIGLRAINQNPGGADLSLAALTTWNRNLAVDTGATIELGAANPFVIGSGTLHGKGTLASLGTIQIAPSANVSPGMDDIGSLNFAGNLELLGRLLIDVSNSASDSLAVNGTISIGGRLKLSGSVGATGITLATYTGALTGQFSAITGLGPDFAVDYGTGINSQIKIIHSAQSTVVWSGANGASTWDISAANWQGGAVFAARKNVLFDESSGNRNVVIGSGGVLPGLITVDNVNPYTIESSVGGAMGGTARLVKQGSGLLQLKGPASYSGGTSVLEGKLQIESQDALPDFGPVVVSSGAVIDLRGFNDKVEDLSVDGSVNGLASTLTVASISLGNGAVLQPSLILLGDLNKSGPIATLLGKVQLGGEQRTFRIDPYASLTISGSVSNGALVKAGDGTLTLSGTNSQTRTAVVGGTLVAASAGALPTGSDVSIAAGGALNLSGAITSLGSMDLAGSLLLGSSALTLTSLEGSGPINLQSNSLTVNQSVDSGFGGQISGSGALVKAGAGILRLTAASSFTGGVIVSGGILSLASSNSAGTGLIAVGSGGILDLSASIANTVELSGGTIGSSAVGNLTGGLTVKSGSVLRAADPKDPAVGIDLILTGSLQGLGNLAIQGATGIAGADGAAGVRLRSTTSPSPENIYGGAITVLQSAKFELQSSSTNPFSPAGSGKIILTAGLRAATSQEPRAGTYSQLNLRNDRTDGEIALSNSVEIGGSGFANVNPVGSAQPGSMVRMGNLRIGQDQTMGVNTDAENYRVFFSSVTLTGGIAAFAPTTSGMEYHGAADLILGPIGETSPGSGIQMEGDGGLYLSGSSNYTGATTILAGTMYLGAERALPASTALSMGGGVLEFLYPEHSAASQTVASLSGSGGVISNNNLVSPAVLTVNQTADTAFEGYVSGNLGITKQGAGKLSLNGSSSYSGVTMVSDGTLEINGTIAGDMVVIAPGGILAGDGIISSPVSVYGTLAPGRNGAGTLTLAGGSLTLGPESQTLLQVTGSSQSPQYDGIMGVGLLTLDGTIKISLGDGVSLAPGFALHFFGARGIAAQNFNLSTDLLLPAIAGNLAWNTDSFVKDGTIYVVPEANSFNAIVCACACAFGWFRRRLANRPATF